MNSRSATREVFIRRSKKSRASAGNRAELGDRGPEGVDREVGQDEGEVPRREVGQDRLDRAAAVAELDRRAGLARAFPAHHRPEQRRLVREVAIHRRLGDARLAGDVVDAGALVALGDDHRSRPLDHLLQLALGPGGQRRNRFRPSADLSSDLSSPTAGTPVRQHCRFFHQVATTPAAVHGGREKTERNGFVYH